MVGRSPHEAVTSSLAPMTRAVSCIPDAVLNVSGGYDQRREHAAVLGAGRPIRILNAGLVVRIRQNYRVVEAVDERGPFKVQVTGYAYSLEEADSQKEILIYHWHPGSEVRWPHLHIGPGASLGSQVMSEVHLPTGRVALEDFIQLIIEGFGGKPMRNDWAAVLDDSRERFRTWRTWG